MGIIKDYFDKRKALKNKLKEYEDNDKVVENLENRKLSHNERELIAILK